VACISVCACLTTSAASAHSQTTTSPSGGVVSASLCSDAYVLALVEHADIAALSWQVDQPVSAAPAWARRLPQAWPDAERLLTLEPAHLVFGAGEGGRAAALLSRAGRESFELAWGEDFDAVRRNMTALGAYLGRDAEAASWIAGLDARLHALEERAALRSTDPGIVYLSSSGGSSGAGTYVDAAIRAAGGRNVVAEAGAFGWTRGDPEFALTLDVDILLTSYFVDGYASTFNRGSRHAGYGRMLERAERHDISSGDWPCAGPRLIDAAEAIADILDQYALSDASQAGREGGS
jgi:iron complex transport system substrate-binding protein